MQTFLTYIILLAALLFADANTFAANTARETLDKAAAKVNLTKGAYASFTINGGSIGTQSGSVAMKGNKFNAKTKNAIIWFDGKTQWLYNKNNKEVNVSSPKASQLAGMNPYYFLNIYKKGYKLSQTVTAKGYNVHVYGSLTGIKEMYIITDKQYNIKQIKLKQGSQWLTITINNISSKSYTDSAFRFNAKEYPNAEIIDLR